ncbi:MAG: hypothetical protein IJV80_01105 [Clostridia bacterium]|nr:hypothetical protein [Clostridia bacterium]
MKNKKLIVIVLTVVIFLTAALLGFTTVYRIDGVNLQISLYSDEAKAEGAQLEEKLNGLYVGENLVFASPEAAEEVFADYPYFRMAEFKKEYPNKLVIVAKEDVEVYAFESGSQYYIVGLDGTILGVRDNPVNRSDGGNNVLVKGVTVSGQKGEKISGDDCLNALIEAGQAISACVDGVRSNFTEIRVEKPTSDPSQTIFRIKTRETVNLYIRNPYSKTQEKATAIVTAYLGLEDGQRLCGMLLADEGTDGTVLAKHYNSDTLAQYFND